MSGPRKAGESALVLLGATATGKTAVAIDVARQVSGEVISADSRAYFMGMDIVTDTPSPEEQCGIPHHLLNFIPITGSYDAMTFRRDVTRLLPEIRGRGRLPLIVGGGTLYLGAILRGLFEGPAKDAALRSALRRQSSEALYADLESVDPRSADRIHRNDRLRIVRALEVFQLTGRPMSDWQAEAEPLPEAFCVVGLCRDRIEHRAIIETRVRRMISRGVFAEVECLLARGLRPGMQAFRTIGVPEAVAVLEGKMSSEQYVETVSNRTWQLVRRQSAWFRRDKNVRWISMTGRTAADVAEQIVHTGDLSMKRG
jgi:tRNA dimethylallyltransferase